MRAARRALGQTRDEQYALTLQYAEALAALGRGDLGAARRLAADGLEEYRGAMSGRYVWPVLWLAARAEADEATLARDRREEVPAGAAARRRELMSLAAELAVPNAASRGYRALVTAELARAAGRSQDDARSLMGAWSAAAQAWQAAGRALSAGLRPAAAGRGRRGGGRPPGRRPRASARPTRWPAGSARCPSRTRPPRWPGGPG